MYIFGNPKFNMNIVVARHGSTILNEDNKYQGIKYDYHLTEDGKKEIAMLREKLQDLCTFDAIFTSDTIRAQETAEILTGIPREQFIVDTRLCPFDLGDADGKKESELFTISRFPILAKGKEQLIRSYLKRIRMFLRDTLAEYNGKSILIVTHDDISGIMDAYLCNYPFVKGPHNGIKNGNARIYYLRDNQPSKYAQVEKLESKNIHFHGPQNIVVQKRNIYGKNNKNSMEK